MDPLYSAAEEGQSKVEEQEEACLRAKWRPQRPATNGHQRAPTMPRCPRPDAGRGEPADSPRAAEAARGYARAVGGDDRWGVRGEGARTAWADMGLAEGERIRGHGGGCAAGDGALALGVVRKVSARCGEGVHECRRTDK